MKLRNQNLLKVGLFFALVVFISSCNRGGTGCPYELNIGLDLLDLFM